MDNTGKKERGVIRIPDCQAAANNTKIRKNALQEVSGSA